MLGENVQKKQRGQSEVSQGQPLPENQLLTAKTNERSVHIAICPWPLLFTQLVSFFNLINYSLMPKKSFRALTKRI